MFTASLSLSKTLAGDMTYVTSSQKYDRQIDGHFCFIQIDWQKIHTRCCYISPTKITALHSSVEVKWLLKLYMDFNNVYEYTGVTFPTVYSTRTSATVSKLYRQYENMTAQVSSTGS